MLPERTSHLCPWPWIGKFAAPWTSIIKPRSTSFRSNLPFPSLQIPNIPEHKHCWKVFTLSPFTAVSQHADQQQNQSNRPDRQPQKDKILH